MAQGRKVASTKMNDTSSRSHLVFSVIIQNHVPATNATTMGKMTFVDLPGSERVGRSGAINDETRLNEAKAINKSLSALGDVVQALTTTQQFVPYRNHKLTQLMADSLGAPHNTDRRELEVLHEFEQVFTDDPLLTPS